MYAQFSYSFHTPHAAKLQSLSLSLYTVYIRRAIGGAKNFFNDFDPKLGSFKSEEGVCVQYMQYNETHKGSLIFHNYTQTRHKNDRL